MQSFASVRRCLHSFAAGAAIAVVASLGCEGSRSADAPQAPPPPATTAVAPPVELEAAAPPEPAPPPLELTSPEQALDEMISAVDERRSRDYQTAHLYLQSRGPEVVPLIEARLASGGLSAAAEIALVRQLSPAGETALPVLENLTAADRSDIVRLNAIEQIAKVRPVTPRATDFLRTILRDGAERDRMEALKALDRMEADSPEFVEDLRAIMQSDAPEELRRKAKESLDRAKPRRTFEDRD